jgi:hypothetical protein
MSSHFTSKDELMMTIDIVSFKDRKIIPIHNSGWDYVYIPMTEVEKKKYMGNKIKDPCWRIGIQPKEHAKFVI